MPMKTIMLFTALLVSLVAMHTTADSRELRRNETYCLETSMAGDRGGGGTHMDCSFETLAQCNATRMGLSGWCMLNPVIAFERRNGTRRHKGHRYDDDD
jgi:hypothetical protein